MILGSYLPILKVVIQGRSAVNILIATLISFSFSISVILSTFGLMDGFDFLLKSGLRHSSGDILVTSRKGFFKFDSDLEAIVKESKPLAYTAVIQTEAFILSGEKSKGILVRGVDPKGFKKSSGVTVKLNSNEIVIGNVLAKELGLTIGDEVALAFGKGNESSEELPGLRLFKISDIVTHGIYQKDLRFVYLHRNDVADQINVKDKVNQLILTYQAPSMPLKSLEILKKPQDYLRRNLDVNFQVKPFWSEFSFLIEAVKVEKFSISLILQLIVVVAVFNILAFVIYIMEKKSQEFFFLRAIGLSLNKISHFWFLIILSIWSLSCLGAYFLTEVFNWGLQHLTFLKIPGEIYVLSGLSLKLDIMDYLLVYFLSLLWIFLAGFMAYIRIRKRTIIQGLRQEFS
jgi:ABC-type lipoprotein release transport system permease subunit